MSNRRTAGSLTGRAPVGSALTLAALTAAAATTALTTLASAGPMPDEWAGAFDFRRLGPANMSGRITDITVYEADPNIFWIAAASGGILKTVNGGTTFEHQFTREAVASVGDIEVSQSNPDIIWVGTGEENPRNSVSWGNGVYKSVDGGETFEHMGLKESFQIGSIRIHPTNPDVVYVGALGRLWGPNEERGLFRTTDGGATWEHIIAIDADTGIMDIELHPEDPDTIMVASYERRRDMFDTNDPATKFGENAGIWRSSDGGDSWERMVEGLPTVPLGRMDIEYFRGNPDRVYAMIETELIGTEPENAPYMGIRGEDAGVGARLTDITEDGPAADAGLKNGDIVLKMNDRPTLTYTGLTTEIRKYEAGDSVSLELIRDGEFETLDLTFTKRPSEGDGEVDIEQARRSSPFGTRLGGQRANIQDQQGPNGFENGGLFRSEDGGYTWTRINSINPRPMYFSEIAVDPQDDNFIHVAGISLHTSDDGGKTFRGDAHVGANGAAHVDHHAIWVDPTDGRRVLLGNDGGLYITNDRMRTWDHHNHFDIGQFYHVTVDNRRNYRVYGGLQDNGSWGGPSMVRDAPGSRIEDWYRVGGGDGFICRTDPNDPDLVYYQSQNGGFGRINIRTGERGRIRVRPERGVRNRFNWRAPFILSEFNSRIYYAAGNRVFKSVQGGEDMLPISPNITATERGAATALTESPRNREILYVGTDDGALWMTENGGDDWVDLFDGNEPSGGRMVASAASSSDATDAADAAGETNGARNARVRVAANGEADVAPRARRERGAREARGTAGRDAAPAERNGAGGRGAAMLEMLLAQDADKDGRIARSEMSGRMSRMFDRLDADGNDVLDRTELKALADRLGVPLPPVEADGPALASEVAAAMRDLTEATVSAGAMVARADDVSGVWTGTAAGDAVETGSREITMNFTLKGTEITGSLTSPMGEIPVEGTWDAEKRSMLLDADTGEFTLTITGKIDEDGELKADVEVGGMVVATIEAKRTRPAAGTEAADAGSEPRAAGERRGRGGEARGQGDRPARGQGQRPARGQGDRADRGQRGGGGGQADRDATPGGSPIHELIPTRMLVSELVASRYDTDRVYMTMDGHRSNIDLPYVFMSEDRGRTWRPLSDNLPDDAGSARTISEDISNGNVLWLGTEFGLWVTLDRGEHWTRFHGQDFPTVAVHAIAQHEASGEVIVGTHGRSIWAVDATTVRQMDEEALDARAKLYRPNTLVYWRTEPGRGSTLRKFTAENPSRTLPVHYSLGRDARAVSVEVMTLGGDLIRTLENAPNEAGLHALQWDGRRAAPANADARRRRFGGPRVGPGVYMVRLTVDGAVSTETFTIEGDPEQPQTILWGEHYDEQLELAEEALAGDEDGDDDEGTKRRFN